MPEATVDLNSTTIDELARLVSRIYAPVSLSEDPTFRWLNVFTDITILGEEIRRGASRREDAIARTMKVIIRLLDFVGFYLYRNIDDSTDDDTEDFASFFAGILQTSSYLKYFPDPEHPPEGPTRWILVKYPQKCAKCAGAPCLCVLTPWTFEERRQKPAGYENFRTNTEIAREQLSKTAHSLFTLPTLFAFFADIYRNTYYNQDHWKTAMHLNEEAGEVTAQLVRVQLLHYVRRDPALLGKSSRVWGPIKKEARGRLERVLARVLDEMKSDLQQKKGDALDAALKAARTSDDPARHVAVLAGEKLKEEIADVFSWISAVVYQLSRPEELSAEYLRQLLEKEEYLHSVHEGQLELKCKWCGKRKCSNRCLVNHGVAAELYENAAKF